MVDINICLDNVGYKEKPAGNEAAQISNRIGEGSRLLNCPACYIEFIHKVGRRGYTFSPATFDNKTRSEKNFKQMQLFVLDFDGGISYNDVRDRANQYDLPILFAYDTLSSEDYNEKFRVVFLNDVPVNDKKAAKILKNALMTVFPEGDKHDNDISRMYYGGKGVKYYNPNLPTVNPESIVRSMALYLKDRRGSNHYKKYIKDFAYKHGVRLTKKGLLDVSIMEGSTESNGTSDNGKILPNSILLLKSDGINYPNSYYQINLEDDGTKNSVVEKRHRTRTTHRSDTLKDFSHKCQLFHEFESGKRWLTHNELFGLSTNIIHVESGATTFMEIISGYPEYYDLAKQNNFAFYLRYNKEQDYNPQSCNIFCPYKDTCKHGRNILLTVKPNRGMMERVANYTEILHSIEEAQDDLERIFSLAINANDHMWQIIKAQTSIGKTEIVLKLMKTSGLRFLIAVPTNKLKWDVKRRADEKGVELMATPSLDDIKDEMPAEIWSHICHLRETGQHKKVHAFVCRMAEEENIKCLKKYLKQQEEYEEYDGHTVTTHRRLLNMSEKTLAKYDVVIVDEDIILSSIASNQCTIPISLLKKISRKISKNPQKNPSYMKLASKIKKVLKAIETESLFKLTAFKWEDGTNEGNVKNEKEDVEGIPAHTDIPSFCLAEHFMYRKASEERNLSEDSIVFLKPWKFKNIKYIMVSATVDKDICEYSFGKQNVQFYECKMAAYEGTLNQYYDKSMSRSCIDTELGILKKISKWSGFRHIITHKKYNVGDMYFGNAIGCDNLKGQNIDVVGTPYKRDFLYKLLPYTLGLPVNGDAYMKSSIVVHNGYRFHFTTFGEEHDVLRKFHFWMIESELEQAVGRARLLREPCIVNLFSNFPLKQAVMKDDKSWQL